MPGRSTRKAQAVSEKKRPIKVEVRATLEIDPRDESIIDEWDIERLRHLVFEICESTAEVTLSGGIRATVRFITPTPFELKAAQLGDETLASIYVGPLPDEPDVQVVVRWRDGVASLCEVLAVRRLLKGVCRWQPVRAIEHARSSSGWVLGVCHPAHARRLEERAKWAGLVAVVEPFVPPDESPQQFGDRWGCEVPPKWWPR